ncbi:efflux RND transporter periplasmic adaptor subunit [Chloroflexota bacterium]
MKKKFKLGLILTLACLLLVSLNACGSQADTIEQQLVEVTQGDLVLSVDADGNLSLPWHRQLAFGTSGTVAKINVEEGDTVTKGQLLASLGTISLELAVKTAQIDLEKATDNYRKLTYPYDFRTWSLDVPASVARISDAQQELDGAVETMQELGLSREQYDWEQYWDVWHRLKRVQDDLLAARENLIRGYGQDVFESGILSMTDRWTLRAAQLETEKAQITLDNAQSELEKTVIIAPFDGVIAAADVKEGDKLSSFDYATTIVLELIDPSIMEIKADVDEIDIPIVEVGQRAIIRVDALPDAQFEGKVSYIYPLPIEESGVIFYEVKIGFDVPEGSGLLAGMSASVDIIITEQSNVLLVPSRAVEQDSSGNPVVRVMIGEQVEERSVVIGVSDGYQTEIVDGLDAGEVVVIERRVKSETSGGGLFGQ